MISESKDKIKKICIFPQLCPDFKKNTLVCENFLFHVFLLHKPSS